MEKINTNDMSTEQMVSLIKLLSITVELMQRDVTFLRCLEGAGVDNWTGYDYALELRDE